MCRLTCFICQSYFYSTSSLHTFILLLFEKYAMLLEKQFSQRFDDVCRLLIATMQMLNFHLSRLSKKMITYPCTWRMLKKEMPFWTSFGSVAQNQARSSCEFLCINLLTSLFTCPQRSALPLNLPWSQTFYLCCQEVGWH